MSEKRCSYLLDACQILKIHVLVSRWKVKSINHFLKLMKAPRRIYHINVHADVPEFNSAFTRRDKINFCLSSSNFSNRCSIIRFLRKFDLRLPERQIQAQDIYVDGLTAISDNNLIMSKICSHLDVISRQSLYHASPYLKRALLRLFQPQDIFNKYY